MEVSGYHPPISINVTEYRVFFFDDSQNGAVNMTFQDREYPCRLQNRAVASQTKYHRRIRTMVFAFD